MFSKKATIKSTNSNYDKITKLKYELKTADAIVIGAGAGLSASAGLDYTGKRFTQYFGDFQKKYGIQDMYSGGFYPFISLEEHWAWWSRQILLNRYGQTPKPIYEDLLGLINDKDYFVLTTNVDHKFQQAGFDKQRLFYTQGDYGLWQCATPCHQKTYDNQKAVCQMVEAQGFHVTKAGLKLPTDTAPKMAIPAQLVPYCPKCGRPMTMNLRCDDTFVQDTGWHAAANRYEAFLRRHKRSKILFLELGVGDNTPIIIKYSFWKMTCQNPMATYACVNLSQAYCPKEIQSRSICIEDDIGHIFNQLRS